MTLFKSRFKVVPFETKTLTWWRARRNKIDMDPPYQRRGRLWSRADKAYLVDSILNGYDVPKIYVADFTYRDSPLNLNKLPYAIIDGKQRLEAIFDFFDGQLVLNEDFQYVDDPSLKLAGLSYRDLQQNHPEVADLFDNYNLAVMSVIADSEGPINELFVRLNRSKPLTGAEVRNAMRGPAPQVIRQISNHDFFRVNIRFNVSRGADRNAAAKLLLFEYGNDVAETKKRNLDGFVGEVRDGQPERLELAARVVIEMLGTLAEVFLPNDTLLGSSGVVPVYYWFVRALTDVDLPLVREFLVDFERTRRENRARVTQTISPDEIDSALLDYDKYNRSTNDVASHRGRFQILVDRFGHWKRNRATRIHRSNDDWVSILGG